MGRWGGAVGHHRARGDPLTSPFPPPPPHTAPEEEPAVEGECAKGVQGGAGGKRALVQMLAVPLRPMGGRRVSGGAGLCKRRRRRRPMGRAEGRGLHRECAMQAGLGGGSVQHTWVCACKQRGLWEERARSGSVQRGLARGQCGARERANEPTTQCRPACKGRVCTQEGGAWACKARRLHEGQAGRTARGANALHEQRASSGTCHAHPAPPPLPFPPAFARGVQRNPPPFRPPLVQKGPPISTL